MRLEGINSLSLLSDLLISGSARGTKTKMNQHSRIYNELRWRRFDRKYSKYILIVLAGIGAYAVQCTQALGYIADITNHAH